MKNLLLLFLLLTPLFSNDIKVKARQHGDVIHGKILIKSLMTNNDYISHIRGNVKDTIVLDIWTSPFLEKNPLINFHYKYKGIDDTLKVIVTNNKNEKIRSTERIKQSLGKDKFLNRKVENRKNFQSNNEKIWQARTIETAIQEVYGDKIYYEKNIFSDKNLIIMDNPIIKIKSNENIESIAIFSNIYKRATIAIINITENISIIDYQLKIKGKKDGKIIIIAKANNDKYYKFTYFIEQVSCVLDGDTDIIDLVIKK